MLIIYGNVAEQVDFFLLVELHMHWEGSAQSLQGRIVFVAIPYKKKFFFLGTELSVFTAAICYETNKIWHTFA